jgi:hypothetical protein
MTAPKKIYARHQSWIAAELQRGSYDGLASGQSQSLTAHYSQSADSILSYEVDYSEWLSTGDTIIASAWYSDEGLTISRISFTDTTATAFVSSGLAGYQYQVFNHISTSAGLQQDRLLTFNITQGGLPDATPGLAGVGTLTAAVVAS